MKKILIMVLLAMLASASTALAVAPTVVTNVPGTGVAHDGTVGALPIGTSTFVVSTNVTLYADADAGGYNVAAKHLSGDLTFVSSSIAPGISEVTAAVSGLDKGEILTSVLADPTTANIYTQ